MYDFAVTFGRGEPWHPELRHIFHEGQRTRVLDVPANTYGSEARTIQHIDFKYRNIPGEGHARVQVWALPRWRSIVASGTARAG